MDMRTDDDSHPRRAALAAAALTAALLAAGVGGCGDDSGDGAAGGGDGTATVGILVPLTGELGSFGKPWQQAVELAADEANEQGGLPARLRTVVDDEKTEPQVAVQVARRMIDGQDAAVLIGPSSGPIVAIAPVAKRSRVPVIGVASGTVSLNRLGGDYVYRTVASDDSDGLAIAKFLSDQEATNVGLLVQNEESTLSPAETFRRSFEESGGNVVSSVTFNPDQSSYRAEVQKVLGANPDWIVCACGQQSGVTILKQADAAGYDGEWMVTADIITPEAIDAVGKDVMEGVYGEVASSDDTLPAYKDFAAAYKDAHGDDPYPFTANAYDAGVLVALAMAAADSTSGEDINEKIPEVANPPGTTVGSLADGLAALEKGEDINYEGASGPVDLDETGTASSPYSVQQVTDGKWKQVEFYGADVFAER
jgi:branched-chain amino acid transport system substrate-binding protein